MHTLAVVYLLFLAVYLLLRVTGARPSAQLKAGALAGYLGMALGIVVVLSS